VWVEYANRTMSTRVGVANFRVDRSRPTTDLIMRASSHGIRVDNQVISSRPTLNSNTVPVTQLLRVARCPQLVRTGSTAKLSCAQQLVAQASRPTDWKAVRKPHAMKLKLAAALQLTPSGHWLVATANYMTCPVPLQQPPPTSRR